MDRHERWKRAAVVRLVNFLVLLLPIYDYSLDGSPLTNFSERLDLKNLTGILIFLGIHLNMFDKFRPILSINGRWLPFHFKSHEVVIRFVISFLSHLSVEYKTYRDNQSVSLKVLNGNHLLCWQVKEAIRQKWWYSMKRFLSRISQNLPCVPLFVWS